MTVRAPIFRRTSAHAHDLGRRSASRIAIVGTGFVADLYMDSLRSYPEIQVVKAFDLDRPRLLAFCAHWGVAAAASLDDLLGEGAGAPQIVVNLTNPSAHFEVSRACLEAGRHVYSEKPLATTMADARALVALARRRGLLLASAPCNVLGEAAQTLWLALRKNAIGRVRLVYAELDDDFLLQAPYKKWTSASGAPWPFRDEFMVGCTLEHAGYYVSWLLAMFGRVEKVVAASANLIVAKLCNSQTAPDFSCASLFFASGVVARLTCSIVAPRDHAIRIIGDDGVLELEENWNNDAPVRLRRRYVVRRRLVNSPLARRLRLGQSTHPKVRRWGAPGMDFALASVEMLDALAQSRPCRLSAEFALHLTEVVLAIQNTNGA